MKTISGIETIINLMVQREIGWAKIENIIQKNKMYQNSQLALYKFALEPDKLQAVQRVLKHN